MTPEQLEDIRQAVKVMRNGGVILYPTDTVWGLGCDATDEESVRRIFDIKHRADSKSLITLIPDPDWLWTYTENPPDVAWELIEAAVKPVTVVYDKALRLAPSLSASDGSVGIRVTREEISRELTRRFGKPIVSTSANISGAPTPLTFSQITPEILDAVDYVMTSRRDDNRPHRPSQIIKLTNSGIVSIIRR